jgi:hypothetical protein
MCLIIPFMQNAHYPQQREMYPARGASVFWVTHTFVSRLFVEASHPFHQNIFLFFIGGKAP